MSKEKIIGVIEDVQTKPQGSWTQKSCDLIFTDRRLICIKVGSSTFIAGALGSGISGPSGAIAFSSDAHTEQEINRKKQKGKTLDELVALDTGNYAIWYSDVVKGSFKTGFLSTLGLLAPLTIQTEDGKYFYNIYNQQKEYAKALIEATMPQIKT